MLEQYLSKNLKEGEEVFGIVRRSLISFARSILVAVIAVLAPFFFLFPLLRLGVWGVVVMLALFFVGCLLTLRIVILYLLNVLCVTNRRVIDFDQRGFFHRVVSECTYDKIQDISFSIKGLSQTLLRYGNVQIQTAGSQANLEIENVRNPERVQQLVTRVQTEFLENSKRDVETLSAEELVELAARMKRGLGEERFRELLRPSPRSEDHPGKEDHASKKNAPQ